MNFATYATSSMIPNHSAAYRCHIVHSNISKYQKNRLQHIQSSLARTPNSFHITPVLNSSHWLTVMNASNAHKAFITQTVAQSGEAGAANSIVHSRTVSEKLDGAYDGGDALQ